MNKNLHRVIFNKARGIRMVVQETASSEGKASNGSTQTGAADAGASSAGSLRTVRSFLSDFPFFAAARTAGMLALALGAPAGFAQIIADPSAPNRQCQCRCESECRPGQHCHGGLTHQHARQAVHYRQHGCRPNAGQHRRPPGWPAIANSGWAVKQPSRKH
ncbi:ESPR domain-containing protein [Comamonas testosteroni]|uniref:ESPR domain-containing protein n=1 Tax=Comamonas testosteroni TaxID=285 RepID=UPI0009BD0721